jgi:hypothetical protein
VVDDTNSISIYYESKEDYIQEGLKYITEKNEFYLDIDRQNKRLNLKQIQKEISFH